MNSETEKSVNVNVHSISESSILRCWNFNVRIKVEKEYICFRKHINGGIYAIMPDSQGNYSLTIINNRINDVDVDIEVKGEKIGCFQIKWGDEKIIEQSLINKENLVWCPSEILREEFSDYHNSTFPNDLVFLKIKFLEMNPFSYYVLSVDAPFYDNQRHKSAVLGNQPKSVESFSVSFRMIPSSLTEKIPREHWISFYPDTIIPPIL